MDLIIQGSKAALVEPLKQENINYTNHSDRFSDIINSKKAGWLILLCIYSITLLIGVGLIQSLNTLENRLLRVFIAIMIVTTILICCSMVLSKANIFGPFWGIATLIIAWYWFEDSHSIHGIEKVFAIISATIYGIMKFLSWASKWKGLSHQNNIYNEIKNKIQGNESTNIFLYIFGLNFIPTLILFLGLISFYNIFFTIKHQNVALIYFGFLITLCGIIVEGIAERQLLLSKR